MAAGSWTLLSSLLKLLWRRMDRDRTARLQQIIAAVQRRWGARALRLGREPNLAIPVLATGRAELDTLLGIGGIPRGRISEFLGTPTSRMSTIVLTMMARAQAAGDAVAYIDLSRTFDPEYAASLGLDLSALLLVRPPSAADALEIIHALVASSGVGVLVVDSLALLQSEPRDAQLLAQALRVLPAPLAASPCALIALTVLPYSPAMTRSFSLGGSLLGHATAIRLHLAREDWLATGLELPGCATSITVLKHQLAAPQAKARLLIHFDAYGSLP
jgi:recombination protein RecA